MSELQTLGQAGNGLSLASVGADLSAVKADIAVLRGEAGWLFPAHFALNLPPGLTIVRHAHANGVVVETSAAETRLSYGFNLDSDVAVDIVFGK